LIYRMDETSLHSKNIRHGKKTWDPTKNFT
jgi:hypothetical protein